ncbi:MAG: SPOR domain-containing protein [Paludibacteraceae bacterium]|nr:SPOR domain-containing protein [Paludibacteraceae bacterium]
MKIDKYIIQLLARHGAATITGVGVFRLEHRNALLYNSSILPPGDVITFTEKKDCRDNALAELVMRDLKITFEKASAIVKEEARNLDPYSLTGWHNSLPQNYGLTVIPVTEIHKDNVFLSLGKYAAAVAVALLVNLSVPVNRIADQPTAEARLIPEFFANREKPEEMGAEVTEEPEPKEFHVIVSSLNSREDAVNWIIAKSGCDSLEIVEGNGHYRISAGRFATYGEAATFIKNRNITAWVLQVSSINSP